MSELLKELRFYFCWHKPDRPNPCHVDRNEMRMKHFCTKCGYYFWMKFGPEREDEK